MRIVWPWRRVPESSDTRDARAEAAASARDLARVRCQRPEAEALAALGREQRKRNHFGEGIEAAMRRRIV